MRISLQNIHKHYGSVKANDGVTIMVEPGKIYGILGENGAGKSTLMKILAGYTQQTSGTILMDDSPVNYRSSAQASSLGIGMLYQDPLDFPSLSVLDNFMLGQMNGIAKPLSLSFLGWGSAVHFRKKFEQIADHLNFSLQPDDSVKSLTIGERQQLEILRLLSQGTQILILDEPTTGISGIQKEILFNALRELASEGKSIILVSHKLEDVESLCNKVTVLRQGMVTGEMDKPFDTSHLLEMMFGPPPVSLSRLRVRSEINLHFQGLSHPHGKARGERIASYLTDEQRSHAEWIGASKCEVISERALSTVPGENVLVMIKVSAPGERTGLRNCNIVIRQGEVVGLAGLEGSGQGVFLRIAAGLKIPSSGEVHLQGIKTNGKNYHKFKQMRVSFLPGSRLEGGLISGLSIAEHFALQDNRKGFFVRWTDAFEKAKKRIKSFRIMGTPESLVESLSGGNQQRLLLSFLPEDPILLLLENPTRGLDIETAYRFWQHLHKYCEDNTAIVFSSSELDEIFMAADRVLVFFDGIIIKDVKTSETDVHELALAITGKL